MAITPSAQATSTSSGSTSARGERGRNHRTPVSRKKYAWCAAPAASNGLKDDGNDYSPSSFDNSPSLRIIKLAWYYGAACGCVFVPLYFSADSFERPRDAALTSHPVYIPVIVSCSACSS